jgi:hypothetical protein
MLRAVAVVTALPYGFPISTTMFGFVAVAMVIFESWRERTVFLQLTPFGSAFRSVCHGLHG